MKSIKFTDRELEAIWWALGQITCGDEDDCGSSASRYRHAHLAFAKVHPLVRSAAKDEKKKKPHVFAD